MSRANWRNALTMVFLSLIWGSSFILIKKGLIAFSPLQVGCLRILISALAFSPFFLLRMKTIDWSKLKYLLIVSLCGSGLPAFLFPLAQRTVDSGVAGIFNSLTPIFTLLFGAWFFRNKMTPFKLGGTLIGFAGVSILLLADRHKGIDLEALPVLFLILATMCYATSVNTIKSYLAEWNPLTISALTFTLASPLAIVVLLTTDLEGIEYGTTDFTWSLLAIVVLSLVGTFLATAIFFRLVQQTDALFGSMVAYFMPIVALFWGFLDGEVITWHHIAGMVCIFGGVYLARRKARGNLVIGNR